MATAGSLDFVLSADSTQLRQELGKVRQESQTTALAITNLFSNDTINAVSFKLLRGTITGVISDIDEMNAGLSLSDSLVRNLTGSFGELGDIALLQLGQIAQFLGDDLFQTPLAGLQSEALENVGLGQLENAFQIITAGSNAAKVLEAALGGVAGGLSLVDGVLGDLQGNAQAAASFFRSIAGNVQLVQSVLVTAADLIDAAINQVLDALAEVSPELKAVRDAAKSVGIEFSLGQAIFGDYISDLKKLDQVASTAADASEQVANGAEAARTGVSGASNAIEEFSNKLAAQQKTAKGFESAIEDLANAGELLEVYNRANEFIEGFTGSLEDNFNAAKGAQTLNNQLELVSKSAGGAREDLAFLGKITNDLGVDFDAAAAGYAQFSTAANLANLSVEQTKDTFAAVTQASAVMGLGVADTQGIFLALQQSLSSGNVQLEELNQLAERVPGTFQAAAAALGVTTGELKGLISAGNVDSAKFLPAFAQQLKSFTESGLVDAMNSGEAAVNRFNNALGDFQIAAGDAWLKVGTPALNTFAKAIEFAAQNEELFSTAIDAILVASIPLFLSGMAKATTAVIQFITANQTASVSIFGKQISATAAQIGKFGAQVGLAYAATILFYRNLDRVQDSAKTTRSAIQSLNKSLLELEKGAGNTGSALQNISVEPPPMDWIDAGVKGLKDFEKQFGFVGTAAVALLSPLISIGLEVNKMINFIKTGRYEVVTASEKALNDQLAAIGDFSDRAQEILGKSLEFRTNANKSDGALAVLKDVEIQLKRIEAARLAANPKDKDALAKLDAEEAEQLKRRGTAQKEVLATQSALNNALAQARQELQNLDPNKLGTKGYEDAKQRLETQVALLEREKGKFDELTKASNATAESIASNFEAASKKLEASFATTQATIEESLAKGAITLEKYQEQQLDAEKKYLTDRLKLNQDAATKLKAELERNTKLKTIDPTKATLTTKQEEDYKDQVEKIETDIAKTRIDIAKNTVSTRKQLNDQELNSIRNSQAEAEAIVQRSENQKIAAIKQRQTTGELSDAEAARKIEAAQQASITTQIQAEKTKLTEIDALKTKGVLTTQEAADQERDILTKLSDLNLQRIDAELKARQDANRKTIDEFEQGLKQAEAAIAQSQNARAQATAKAQLAGADPESTARQQVEAEQAGIAQTLKLRQQELTQVQEFRSRGVLSTKEAADREAQIISSIGDLRLKQINGEIEAQKGLLSAVTSTAGKQTQIQNAAEAERTAQVKESLAARKITAEQAAQTEAQLALQSAAQTLRIKQSELAQIQQLRDSGRLTVAAAAEQEQQLIGEVANARTRVADAELALTERNKQSKISAIDAELNAQKNAAEVTAGLREIEKQSLQNQSNLLSAQSNLLSAQSSLQESRLEGQAKEAENAGNTARAEQLRQQIAQAQLQTAEQQNRIALEQLRLKQEQNVLELEASQLQAQNAILEAEAVLRKAQINGVTAQEIAGLQAILGLRQKQLDALNRQAASQQKINQLEQQTLLTQQQQTREKLKQASTSSGAAQGQLSQGQIGSGSLAPSAGGGFSLGSGTPSVTAITDKLTDTALNSDLATAFKLFNTNLSLKLGFGAGQIGAQAAELSGSSFSGNNEVLGKLDQLIAAVGRPNLTISNVNDLGMAGQIYGDISRDSFRSAGL